jgi:hypothetical protein
MEGMFAAGGQPGRGEKGILLLMMRCGVCVSLPHEFLIITLENTEKMEVKKTERQGGFRSRKRRPNSRSTLL